MTHQEAIELVTKAGFVALDDKITRICLDPTLTSGEAGREIQILYVNTFPKSGTYQIIHLYYLIDALNILGVKLPDENSWDLIDDAERKTAHGNMCRWLAPTHPRTQIAVLPTADPFSDISDESEDQMGLNYIVFNVK